VVVFTLAGSGVLVGEAGSGHLDWKGWWGDEPPYHAPVFVLTHHERAPLEMEGGTTFHFVTDGIEAALQRARAAAGERGVAMGAALRPSTSTLPPA
jgi:dihydrofolate reductase